MSARGHVLAFQPAIGPDDLVRHLLAAYYRARLDSIAPIGDPDPAHWSSPAGFLELTLDLFQLRVGGHADRLGLSPFEGQGERWERRQAMVPSCQQHFSEVDPDHWAQLVIADPALARTSPSGAGRSPADMGHGRPALSPAVGPAPTEPPAVDITHSADPLFYGRPGKDLPEGNSLPHTSSSPGESS